MVKLLICLICGLAIGVGMLQLRHQQLELRHQATAIQGQIEAQQARIWAQQLQIAITTAPNAITETVGKDLDLVPEAKDLGKAGDWLNTGVAPDAE